MVLSQEEARSFGHNYIGTEHLLLGLVSETEGVASQMLSSPGVEADDVRRQVIRLLDDGPPESGSGGRRERDPGETARGPTLFRRRVQGLRTEARFDGQSGTLLVDLDYAYAVRNAEDALVVMDHDELLAGVVEILEGQEIVSVEIGVSRIGDYVLKTFPAVREITVGVADQRDFEAYTVSGFTLSRTFRR